MCNINLPTSVLNNLSKESRERIITIEARLSEIDNEKAMIDDIFYKMDNGDGLL